jgi:hypothetical protein
MPQMKPSLRLFLCVAMILISAGYSVLVIKDIDVAKAIALGYIALMLTILVIVNIGK